MENRACHIRAYLNGIKYSKRNKKRYLIYCVLVDLQYVWMTRTSIKNGGVWKFSYNIEEFVEEINVSFKSSQNLLTNIFVMKRIVTHLVPKKFIFGIPFCKKFWTKKQRHHRPKILLVSHGSAWIFLFLNLKLPLKRNRVAFLRIQKKIRKRN